MPPLFVCVCGRTPQRSQGLRRHQLQCREHIAYRETQLQHIYAKTPDELTNVSDPDNIDSPSSTTASTLSDRDDTDEDGEIQHGVRRVIVDEDEEDESSLPGEPHHLEVADAEEVGALEFESTYDTLSNHADASNETSTSLGSGTFGRGRLASSSGYDSAVRRTFEEVTTRRAGTGIREQAYMNTAYVVPG